MLTFIILNILALVTLFLILIAIIARNDFWIRLLGEIYHGVGIALMAGAVMGYFIALNLNQFLLFFIIGGISLILGVLLILTSETLLIKSYTNSKKTDY